MIINYLAPLSQAWKRTKEVLFQPFNITRWFRLGFTAWLAGMTNCRSSGGGKSGPGGSSAWEEFFNLPETIRNWLMENTFWFGLIIAGAVLVVIIMLLIVWVSSRGKFMFLHNVVGKTDQITFPWKEYRKEGNSLFKWRVLFFILFTILLGILFVNGFQSTREMYYADFPAIDIIKKAIGYGALFTLLFLVAGFIGLILNDFIVPIMYKHRLSTSWAWYRILPFFSRNLMVFVKYSLFVLCCFIAVFFVIILSGFLTCFIGFILLAIPYIGAVVLLPVSYTYRAFSLEFIAQIGDEYNLLDTESNDVEA